ncbi:MAG TPA: LapA family protein [Actinomycetota bacterium]|nr:LapA family protein [Actinomycetota bacterium]
MRRDDDPNDAVPEGRSVGEYRREGPGGKAVATIVAGVLLVILFLQNLDDANIDFLFWDWDVAIGAAILVAAALGFVLGWGFAWLRRRARRLDRREDRRD